VRIFRFFLLFVLVDFLEVLIGVHLQLTAGSLVASNDSIGVHLQSADSPSVINAALNTVAQSPCLVVAVDNQKNLLGIANSTNANGKCSLGHLVGVIVEETGVHDQSVLGQGANASTGGQRCEGLIECNVAVNAAAAQEQVDAAVRSDLVLIALALSFQILSHTIENVDVLSRNINVIEEVVVHKIPVALVVLSGQTNVLVHIKGYNILKGDLAGLIHFDQVAVNAQRRRTGGQAQYEGTVFLMIVDRISNMLGGPSAHFIVVVFDNQFQLNHTPKLNR